MVFDKVQKSIVLVMVDKAKEKRRRRRTQKYISLLKPTALPRHRPVLILIDRAGETPDISARTSTAMPTLCERESKGAKRKGAHLQIPTRLTKISFLHVVVDTSNASFFIQSALVFEVKVTLAPAGMYDDQRLGHRNGVFHELSEASA